MMRAAVVAAPGRAEIKEVEIPRPQPGQVQVQIEGCGVCASSLPLWQGQPWFTYPFPAGAPGHEAWGRITALGDGVQGLHVGDRVTMLGYGGYAEYDVTDAQAVVRLPPALDDQPFPGEAVGCAFNVIRRCGIRPGDTVAIVGIGFLGALLTRLATDAGAHVIAISRRPFSLDIARMYGAAETIAMDDHWRIIEQVKALTNGQFCPVVIEAVGKQWPLDLAAELTAERGRLIIAGYHQDGPRQVNMQLWNWRGLDVINAHERDQQIYVSGMQEAAAAVASGRLDLGPLLTHTFPLERLGEAFDAARDRPEGFLKAVVAISRN
jgi:2-desacetyl-2-hydroxyethyl bacteriochlorophyllide A dehydrogenase